MEVINVAVQSQLVVALFMLSLLVLVTPIVMLIAKISADRDYAKITADGIKKAAETKAWFARRELERQSKK